MRGRRPGPANRTIEGNQMSQGKRIEDRQKIRAKIAQHTENRTESTLLLISESLDDYIEHRIQSDKVLEGILKDIQGNLASMTETKIEKLLTENLN